MKKLFLGLIATVMITNFCNAQIVKPANKIATSVVLVAKYHAVITFLESKDYYKDGISNEEFVKKGLVGITDKKLGGNFPPQLRIGWLNAIRKFFDWLDDTLGGEIDPPKGN